MASVADCSTTQKHNVPLQKISIPTPWKVSGNSKGVGGLKSQNGIWIFSGTTHFDNGDNSLSLLQITIIIDQITYHICKNTSIDISSFCLNFCINYAASFLHNRQIFMHNIPENFCIICNFFLHPDDLYTTCILILCHNILKLKTHLLKMEIKGAAFFQPKQLYHGTQLDVTITTENSNIRNALF